MAASPPGVTACCGSIAHRCAAGTYGLTLFVALPFSFALRGMIAVHLGDSVVADTVASDVNYDWWQEFSAQASGLGTTFTPSIVGFGAVSTTSSAFIDNLPLTTTIAGAMAAWLVLWSFLSGGVLDRYARDAAHARPGFFAACGTHFWRFLRLGRPGLARVLRPLQAGVHPWLFDDVYRGLTRDMTAERSAFVPCACCYLAFGDAAASCNLVFDFARIRVRRRRSHERHRRARRGAPVRAPPSGDAGCIC